MRSVLVLLAVGIASVLAGPLKEKDDGSQRIVGGSTTNIRTYPEMAALLLGISGSNHRQSCGGVVLNNRAILTAAHCVFRHPTNWWRTRLGSTNSNRGGSVFNTARIITHPSYNTVNTDNDIAIIHVTSAISFNNNIRAASIAGANYALGDNQVVWATGWGATREHGALSTQLRHVQIWTINQQICRNQYATLGQPITDNMLCSGWLNVGGRDQCQGDSGGPLFHNRIVVGVCSFGNGCARPNFAGVNARVSRFTNWINTNR